MKQSMSNSRKRQIKRKRDKILKPLTNYDIVHLVTKLKIPYFDGVFMRDELTKKKKKEKKNDLTSKQNECWILNHGSSRTKGTHWTALARFHNMAFYFDSFGKLPPPFEVIDYLSNNDIKLYYNVKQYQNYGSSICGHLCLRFLYDFWRNKMK